VSVDARLLSVEAAANYLSVSKWTIRAYVADGLLQSVRLPSVREPGEPGRRLLIDREDLDRFIEARKRGSSSEPNVGLSAAALKGWRGRKGA
jgi:excisionase family DNA binding protein